MKIYQPDYYDKFQCTASKCPMTCCMQWRIAVDDETFHKWDDEWKEKVKEVEAKLYCGMVRGQFLKHAILFRGKNMSILGELSVH